jgi:hypothetical protein
MEINGWSINMSVDLTLTYTGISDARPQPGVGTYGDS